MNPILEEDLARVGAALAPLWPRLSGARLFMTGGTGFIGRWMLEVLARADTDATVTLLSRNPAAFAARAPHLARRFEMVAGDVLDFLPPSGRFTHVIHAATDASADLNARDPRRMFDTIVTGTRRALDMAVACETRRFFFLSSGAVYGPQPWEISHVGEDWRGGPDQCDPRSAYGEGKRAAEMLCAIYGRQFGLDVVNARIFALLGPLLPLDIHFAAGNFIRDAMTGRTIRVQGSGQAVRSYLYAADLAQWLWTLLLAGEAGAVFNIGSEEAVSIADLARRTAGLLGGPGVEILGRPDPGWNPGRYVPSTAAIRAALGLFPRIGLDEAIRRTALANGWTPREIP
ncbi:NAD-dependent epimerase/dehydratase family protein [Sandaracinobacter sp. RS1-74]|uniref:NAD-dependent epimerase/dehydratase family protein n=1 Tax=Sandaracinobacteroides sayramensis TaxID=2913411 RepID=UPI001EDAF27A|nr:NAD-dependent epimerase/dehydratase family protein [Sandaracinobacteroides sayramensis]MCG2840505.1 NAD-dependent epimerase/dehydratase family protein [Sandaracinobacteroides sayramensis]